MTVNPCDYEHVQPKCSSLNVTLDKPHSPKPINTIQLINTALSTPIMNGLG